MGIELAINPLKSDRFDSQMLGMKSLCMLTDRRKTNGAIAAYISRAIIFGDKFLRKLVFKMVLLQEKQFQEEQEWINGENENNFFFHNTRDYNDEDEEEDHFSNDVSMPTFRKYHCAVVILRNYAMTILSNAWEVIDFHYCHQQNCKDKIQGDKHFCCSAQESISKILWKDLAYALHQPHN